MIKVTNATSLAILLTIYMCSAICISALQAQVSDKTQYVCPPCGHDCLKTVYDKAGACGVCGMKLVDLESVINQPTMVHPEEAERKKVAILIFDGVQIIDYTGPWEVFGQAGFDVYTVAEKPETITTVFGMSVNPGFEFYNCPKPDILLIPGGNVIDTQRNPKVLKWIRDNAKQAEIVLSVCNGAFILAKAGLLDGLTATTTRPLVDGLAVAAPNIKVVHNKRFVDNGKIITSGGLSAGIDAALHVVSRIHGKARAERIAYGLEYTWQSE